MRKVALSHLKVMVHAIKPAVDESVASVFFFLEKLYMQV